MTVPVFNPADEKFWDAVMSRVDPRTPILLLERWARGAGTRSWYMLQDTDDVESARRSVRPGSGLTAYFALDYLVGGAASPDVSSAAASLLAELGPNDELLALQRAEFAPALDVEYIESVEELTDWLKSVATDAVWICRYPDWLPDGDTALSAAVPDKDGVVRDHPY